MNKILVAYFSASGVTANVAKEIAQAVNADLYEIKPETPYSSADLNWMDKQSRSSVEMTDINCRPAIVKDNLDIQQYQTILIGFPIWWYVEPRIIDTFLDSYDFTGKALIPFATSGGSSIEKSVQNLKKHYPKFTWQAGKLLRRREAANWAQKVLK